MGDDKVFHVMHDFWFGVPMIMLFLFGATYEIHDKVHATKFLEPSIL